MSFMSNTLAGAVLGGALLFSASASAMPLMASGLSASAANPESMIIQVQGRRIGGGAARGVRGGGGGAIVRGGGGRNFGGGRAFGGRRGGGIGGAGAAAIGLGILGAAIAAGAAQQQRQPVYQQCWVERRAAYDGWGNFAGYRRVRVCN